MAGAASPARAEAPKSVFIVGDSHVQFLGPLLGTRLEDQGLDNLGYLARVGWSTARFRGRNDLRRRLVWHGQPDLVVIALGGNDRPTDRASYEADLTWVVEEVRAAGASSIVWIGPSSGDASRSDWAAFVSAHHEQNAEWQSEILPELGVRWIDSRPMTEDHHRRDGVHFTRDGYYSWVSGLERTTLPPARENEPVVGVSELG